jgi:hypothetical protein
VARCPAELDPPDVGLLARRLYGRDLSPRAQHLSERVDEIRSGSYRQEVEELKTLPLDTLKKRYEARQIEI